jgi:chromosome segregation ATPase
MRTVSPHATEGNLIEFLASRDFGRTDLPDSESLPFFRLLNASYEERIEILRGIQESGWSAPETFELLCLQILVNMSQHDENAKLQQLLEDRSQWCNQFQSAFGNQSISDVLSEVQALKGCFKQCRMLKERLNKFKHVREYCLELEKQSEEQSRTIESLQENLDASFKESGVLRASLDAKSNEIVELESAFTEFRSEASKEQEKLLTEISQCEKRLGVQNSDIKSLVQELSQLRALQAENGRLKSKCEKLTIVCKKLRDHLSHAQESAKMRIGKRGNEQEVRHLSAIQRDLKSKIGVAVSVMKDQVAENRKLAEQIARLEKDRLLQKQEIETLTVGNKALKIQLESINDRTARDRETLTAQFRFRALNEDTRHQEEITTMRRQHADQINTLMIALLEEFDELQPWSPEDVSSPEFLNALRAIGERYRLAHR